MRGTKSDLSACVTSVYRSKSSRFGIGMVVASNGVLQSERWLGVYLSMPFSLVGPYARAALGLPRDGAGPQKK